MDAGLSNKPDYSWLMANSYDYRFVAYKYYKNSILPDNWPLNFRNPMVKANDQIFMTIIFVNQSWLVNEVITNKNVTSW